jgi:hypothetical protein
MLRDSTQASLFEVLGESDMAWEFNKAENQLYFPAIGSKILFRSLDDFEKLRGTNLAWFGVDELTYTSEEAWLRLEGRLRDPKAKRLCGFGVWTPKGFDWVYRKFIQDPPPGYAVIQAAPFENRHLLKQVPDFYERLRGSYDEAFFEQEVMGGYLNPRRGLVYGSFDRRHNVAELVRDDTIPLLWALDFNVDPMASVVAQVREGVVEVLDEIVLRRATTLEACQQFLKRFPNWRRGLRIYADASGHRAHTVGGSDERVLRDFFGNLKGTEWAIRIPRQNPGVKDRVQLMNAKLRAADGAIGMVVAPGCRELVKDLEEVTWVEGTYEIDKNRDKQRTHLSDALGYLVWQEFSERQTIGMRKNAFKP